MISIFRKNLSSRESRSAVAGLILWVFITNVFFDVIISCLYLKGSSATVRATTLLFFLLSAISHYTTIILVSFLPFALFALYIKNPHILLRISLILLCSSISIILIIDVIIYNLYRFHLNGMVWNLITSGVALDVLSIPSMTWFAFALTVGTILLVQIATVSLVQKFLLELPSPLPIAALLICCIIAGHATYAWADFSRNSSLTRYAKLLPAYRPLTASRAMTKLGFRQPPPSNALTEPERSSLNYPLEELRCTPPGNRLNILMIVIDSWRFDMLNQDATPNITKFANDSIVYENHFSAGNTTRFGFFSLMYGIYGTYWRDFLTEKRGPELLRQVDNSGYDVGIYASAPLINPEFDQTVFVDLLDRISLNQEGNSPVERDTTITNKMLKFLDEHDHAKPFFGLLFYDATHAKLFPPQFAKHTPFEENINYITLDESTDPEPVRNAYLNSLAFVDSEVGVVIDALKKNGFIDDTVLIITGDHGEEFNDLGLNYWGHNSNFAKYQVGTPLVLRVPNREPSRITNTTSHLDIVPTLMQVVFGCTQKSSSYSNGTSLFDHDDIQVAHVSSWDSFALVRKNKINILENKGGYETVDSYYNPMEDEILDSNLARTVIEGMSRFYTR